MKKIEEVVAVVNERKRDDENITKMIELQKQFVGGEVLHNFIEMTLQESGNCESKSEIHNGGSSSGNKRG